MAKKDSGLTLEQQFALVLDDVQKQVLTGKGAERHGRGRCLDDQPIWRLLDLYGPGFAAGQAAKKAEEALGLMQVGENGAYEIIHQDRDKAIEAELSAPSPTSPCWWRGDERRRPSYEFS
jgi:hypothetical protein